MFNISEDEIPKKLHKSPLTDFILEIHFNTELSIEILYGKLYDCIFKDFSDKIETLPLMQVPAFIRDADPNLKYKPLYRSIDNAHHVISLGTHCLVFEHLAPYTAWSEWSSLFYRKLESLQKTNLITTVSGFRLYSIDCFDTDISSQLKIKITIDNEPLGSNSFSLVTKLNIDNVCAELSVKSPPELPPINNRSVKSLISIDCRKDYRKNDFWSRYKTDIENVHTVNKKIFFGLITDALLTTLEPIK